MDKMSNNQEGVRDLVSDDIAEDANVGGDDEDQLAAVGVDPAVACGGDSPPLSDYEKLRERNIRERDEAMKETLEEIESAKQEMRSNAPQPVVVAGGRSKRKKVEPVEEFRSSGRERNPIRYALEGRRGRREESGSSRPSKTRGRKEERSHPPVAIDSSHNLRTRQHVNYTDDEPVPVADGYIWCTPCGKVEYNGCEKHPPFFGDTSEFHLVVEPSSVGGSGRRAGDGVFNRGKMIPEDVLFGPYSGNLIPPSRYEELKNANQESGNAWEVRDKKNKKTVGFMDPGVNPDPHLHWMSKINCPSRAGDLNLVGFQLEGQIYYRVMKNIPCGKELIVSYGDTYATDLGIKLDIIDMHLGRENHVKDAIVCGFCSTGLIGEKELVEHLGKGENRQFKCKVKQREEMIKMAESGEREHVCQECGKGFKTRQLLTSHRVVHSKVKPYKCDVVGCSKSYANRGGLFLHTKSVHEGVKHECAECGKRFGDKSHMNTHYKTVHLQEKKFKCQKCGLQFGENGYLTKHIKTVHEKIRSFKCEHCGKSFGQDQHRKTHIEAVHLNLRYPCTWPDCTHQAHSKTRLKYHRRSTHTKEWSLECKLCEDQLGIWWGCIHPGQMDKHRAKKHPVEWEEEQMAYKSDHPFICGHMRCQKRFGTKVEKDRHEKKMH